MTTFELRSTSTVYMDGTSIYHVRRKGKPGIVASLCLPMSEVERVEELLRLQAENAWQEGHEHYGKYFSPRFPEFGINPYTATEEGK